MSHAARLNSSIVAPVASWRLGAALIGRASATPLSAGGRRQKGLTSRASTSQPPEKKSLARDRRLQKARLHPLRPSLLLPIRFCRSTHHTASSSLHYNTIGSCSLTRSVAASILPDPSSSRSYLLPPITARAIAYCGHLPARQFFIRPYTQTYIQSRCTLASALVGTHCLARAQHPVGCRQTLDNVLPRGHRGLIKESTSEVGLT